MMPNRELQPKKLSYEVWHNCVDIMPQCFTRRRWTIWSFKVLFLETDSSQPPSTQNGSIKDSAFKQHDFNCLSSPRYLINTSAKFRCYCPLIGTIFMSVSPRSLNISQVTNTKHVWLQCVLLFRRCYFRQKGEGKDRECIPDDKYWQKPCNLDKEYCLFVTTHAVNIKAMSTILSLDLTKTSEHE